MAKGKKKAMEVDNKELTNIQSEINKELIKEEKKKKEDNLTYLFFVLFFTNLKNNKLYLLSFFVTVFSIVFFSITRVKEADGIYSASSNNSNTDMVNATVDTGKKNNTNDEIDISIYVGNFYTKEFTLNEPIVLSETCSASSYKFVYQIKKDKTISKYLYNECLGTILVWKDNISYVTSGGAKYVSANGINYLLSASNMKEVDGDTYSVDDSITSLKENNNIKGLTIDFYNNSIIFNTGDNLLLVRGSAINYDLNSNYSNNGGSLDTRVYKTKTSNQYNFIVFANGEKDNCYSKFDNEKEDSIVYTIYSVKYNKNNFSFDEAKELIKRNKSDKCENYESDLAVLKDK